jgi:hypothetical protein
MVRPWKPPPKGDHARTSGGRTGDLDRVLDGFGAGVDQKRLLRRAARGGRIEPLAQLDVGLVGDHLEAGVGEGRQLLARRLDDPGMAVPGIDHRDTGAEVDPATTFDVPDFGIPPAVSANSGVPLADTFGQRCRAGGPSARIGFSAAA